MPLTVALASPCGSPAVDYLQMPCPVPGGPLRSTRSQFDDDEVSGFEAAADDRRIRHLELLWIVDASEGTRLFRSGDYPVLRGTFATIAKGRHLLYTRGSGP